MIRSLAVLLALLALAPACRDRQGLEENVAEVRFGDRSAELTVASCGFDDDVGDEQALVLVATSADLFLQLLLVVHGDEDDRLVDLDASAVSLEVARSGVLGAGNARLLQVPAGTPGPIESARIRGDRVDLEAAVRGLPSDVGDGLSDVSLEVAARCSQIEDLVVAAARAA